MISGIKRKTTAIESTYRYFQTIDLILSHFKRPADRQKIFELADSSPNLSIMLVATASVHLYHNFGIRFPQDSESEHFSDKVARDLEINEKKTLMNEIELLLKNSFNLEIDLLYKIIDLENLFLSFLIEERESSFNDYQKNEKLKEIDQKIEFELLEIIRKYPPFYFYDLLGDLIGLNNHIKREILEEESAFKDLSVDIEKKLDKKEKEDKFIELSTLNRLIKVIHRDYEFKSYKELQVEAMPVRMIKKKILDYEFNKYPVSVSGLRAFLKGNSIKRELLNIINKALQERIIYEDFENSTLNVLKKLIIKQLKTNPNDFIYLIQSLYEYSFDEIMYQLNKRGIYDIMHLINVDDDLISEIKKNMIKFNIKKQDFLALNDKNKNLVNLAKKEIVGLNFPYIEKILEGFDNISEFNLSKFLYRDDLQLKKLWELLEKKTGASINELREFVRKKQYIDKVFLKELGMNNYNQIITLLSFEEVIDNLIRDIFYYILSKILRQLSRIIESYNKINNDKGLILQALKKMDGTLEYEDWINIKLEELIIKRIIRRQNELVIVFNANNQVFLVNGFILSRLTDKPLQECIIELRENSSLIYENIKPLKLQADLISPISYCIAFDLIKRLEVFEEKRKSKVKKVIEIEKREKEIKKQEIREKQKESTFNWIERRITSSLMGINRPGINPNQFYWQEKDTKIATDNIKLHSELSDDPYTRFCDYYNFAVEKIKSFKLDIKLPDYKEIENSVELLGGNVLIERLNHKPSHNEIKSMLDGERYLIAKKIALKIGKILDNALYITFKKKRRNT